MLKPDVKLDTSGLICPLPLLKAKQQLSEMEKGQILQVISTDPSSILDFKVFAEVTENRLLSLKQSKGKYYFMIEKS